MGVMEAQFIRERDRCEDMEKDFNQAKKEREELMALLEELNEGIEMLEAQNGSNKKSIEQLKIEFESTVAERDEVIELLDRAVMQKEHLKSGQQRDVEETQRQVNVLKEELANEQHDIRELLGSVELIFAGLQRGGNNYQSDMFPELLHVRDGMHTLIKKRKLSVAPVEPEPPVERSPSSYKHTWWH